jgi:sulfite reductase (NADPH) flavoprotein alpha-component
LLRVAIESLDDGPAEFAAWRLLVQDHLNPSGADRLYRVGLAPPEGAAIRWRAGDIAEFEMPDGQRRSYSISSVPSEGRLDLLVREARAADGTWGRGPAWLLHETRPGGLLRMRIKSNRAFHAPAGQEPLLLVGAGSGLAGLRPHILEAREAGRPTWLLYGEKQADSHNLLCRELQAWHLGGKLYRLNLALSHPEAGKGRYVQDIITQYATDIRHFMGPGGLVMICGGLALGAAVDAALERALGRTWMGAALTEARYRQALY